MTEAHYINELPRRIGAGNVLCDQIAAIIAKYSGLEPDELKERTRKREVVKFRQLSCWIMNDYAGISMRVIAKYFGIDRTTVLHSRNTVEDVMSVDADYRRYVVAMKEAVKQQIN